MMRFIDTDKLWQESKESKPHIEIGFQASSEKNALLRKKERNPQERIEIAESGLNRKAFDCEALLLGLVQEAMREASSFEDGVQTCLSHICSHKAWSAGHIYVQDKEAPQVLVPTGIWHFDNPGEFEMFRSVTEALRFRIGVGLPGEVFQNAKPSWIPDVARTVSFARAQLGMESGIRSAFAFPVMTDSLVVAVLEFFSRNVEEPSVVFLETMKKVSEEIGAMLKLKGIV